MNIDDDCTGLELPAGRAGLMCATPQCPFRIHDDPRYGGYCCKKCHWHDTSGSKSKKKHGDMCAQREAAPMAPRAPPIPPRDPVNPALRASGGSTSMSRDTEQGYDTDYFAYSKSCPSVWKNWSSATVGRVVTISGLRENVMFNGLDAVVETQAADGRFHLRLANGTLLKYVKRVHFDEPESPLPSPVPLAKAALPKPPPTNASSPSRAAESAPPPQLAPPPPSCAAECAPPQQLAPPPSRAAESAPPPQLAPPPPPSLAQTQARTQEPLRPPPPVMSRAQWEASKLASQADIPPPPPRSSLGVPSVTSGNLAPPPPPRPPPKKVGLQEV